MILGRKEIRNHEQAPKNAQKRDKNGNFALLGMDLYLLTQMNEYFEINDIYENNDIADAVAYCVDTFVEEIEDISFEEWIKNGNESGRPIIMPEWAFKEHFSEIAENNHLLGVRGMINDIAIIYGIEFWSNDFFYDEDAILYTTMYKDYRKIDNRAIERAMEHIGTISEYVEVTEKDKNEFIDEIDKAMNNFLSNGYKVDKMDWTELYETVQNVW